MFIYLFIASLWLYYYVALQIDRLLIWIDRPLCYVIQHTLFEDAWIYAVDAL
jgi:hypothetical protein